MKEIHGRAHTRKLMQLQYIYFRFNLTFVVVQLHETVADLRNLQPTHHFGLADSPILPLPVLPLLPFVPFLSE